MTPRVGLHTYTNTHKQTRTHSGRASHQHYATKFYSCTCTRGHFGHYLLRSEGIKKQWKGAERAATVKFGLSFHVQLGWWLRGHGEVWELTVEFGFCFCFFFRSTLVSILEAARVVSTKGLQVRACALVSTHETSLALTPAVTCSTPPLSPEPTHWLRCLSLPLPLSVTHALTHTHTHTHTHTSTASLSLQLPFLITGTHTTPSPPKKILHGSSKLCTGHLISLRPSRLRTLLSPELAPLVTHTRTCTHTHTANWTCRLDRFEAAHCSTPAHI